MPTVFFQVGEGTISMLIAMFWCCCTVHRKGGNEVLYSRSPLCDIEFSYLLLSLVFIKVCECNPLDCWGYCNTAVVCCLQEVFNWLGMGLDDGGLSSQQQCSLTVLTMCYFHDVCCHWGMGQSIWLV